MVIVAVDEWDASAQKRRVFGFRGKVDPVDRGGAYIQLPSVTVCAVLTYYPNFSLHYILSSKTYDSDTYYSSSGNLNMIF